MNEKRIYYFDIAKCIASYLICLSHFGTLDTHILQSQDVSTYFNYFLLGISSIGVPVFLMVNGAFVLNKHYSFHKIFYRAKSYVMLYLVWGVLTLLLLAPLYNDHYSIREFLSAVFNRKAERTSHLWFLMAMTYIYLLFPFIKAVYDKPEKVYTRYLVVLLFLCTFGYVLVNEVVRTAGYVQNSVTLKQTDIKYLFLFNPFDQWYAYTMLYFICGGMIAKTYSHLRYKTSMLLVLIFISMIVLFAFALLKTRIKGAEYDAVWGGHDSIMTLVMSIAVFLLCAKIKLKNQKVIDATRLVGMNTLGIYFIHVPVGHWLSNYYKSMQVSQFLIVDMLFALILMMTSLFISVQLQKIPFLKRLVKI
ncbi:MAG: acyltransferase [Bacteroidota bacterium]